MAVRSLGQISDIDLRLLRTFRTVVEAGGFTQAEIELNVTASAISISMADLEKRLGVRLCNRGRSGFSLTAEGRQIYAASQQIFTSLESFRLEVNSMHDQLRGELAIGITDNLVSSPEMRITHALTALKQRGPEVRINIHMAPPGEVEVGVLEGKLHVGVVPYVTALKGLDYLQLYAEPAKLYCSDDHPLFDELAPSLEQVLSADAVDATFARSREVRQCHKQLHTSASASDREGIAFLILTGPYIGYLPEHFAKRWVVAGRMRALLPEQLNYQLDYAVVTRKGVRSNLVLDTFLESLRQ